MRSLSRSARRMESGMVADKDDKVVMVVHGVDEHPLPPLAPELRALAEDCAGEVGSLTERVARLEEALRQIADTHPWCDDECPPVCLVRIARSALAEPTACAECKDVGTRTIRPPSVSRYIYVYEDNRVPCSKCGRCAR